MADRKSILFACLLVTALMTASCQFAGRRQGSTGREPDNAVEKQEVVREETGSTEYEEPDVLVTTPVEEVAASDANSEENQVAWHDHDFSLTVVMHKYVNVSTPFPQADETVLVTRVNDKVYFQSSVQGVLQKCSVLEPIPDGYRDTIFKKGKEDWTHDFDNETLNSQVGYRLRHDYMLAQNIPAAVDLAKAKETTRCGRPAWVVEVEEKEDGAKSVSTFVIDQEYRFFYSVKQVGKNKYGQDVNITLFDVTSFTDKPSAKNIPNPKAKTDPMDLYRNLAK